MGSSSSGTRFSTIPKAFIDDLIARIDIIDLIDSYVPLKRAGRNFSACCPFHQEKTPSFSVSQTKQFYHCFGCGVSGNVVGFMMAYRNLDFREAIIELASRVGLEVPQENTAVSKLSQNLYILLSEVASYYQAQLQQSPKAKEYLSNRGLSQSIIDEYQLGYAKEGWNHLSHAFPKSEKALISTGMLVEKSPGRSYDAYRDRIMFPIHDRRGRVIGFGGRVLESAQQPKYINSPETTLFHKSKSLYGLYQVAQKNPHPEFILIVEGYMDVIALAQHGIPYVVATLGTATTREHVQSLLRYTQHLIFCFDGDNAGRKAGWKALESALPYLDAKAKFQFMFLPEGEDPDTLIRQGGVDLLARYIREAKMLDSLFFEELAQNLDLSTMADRGKLVEITKPYFALMPPCAYRDLMMEELGHKVRMSINLLQGQVSVEPSSISSQGKESTITKNHARIALTLLIQRPDFVDYVTVIPSPDSMEPKSGQILCELMTKIKENNIRTTGGLLEHYRGHEYMAWMSKLAAASHNIPTDEKEEFLGALDKMQKEFLEGKIKKINRQKESTKFADTSHEERLALLEMIKKKQK
jgi:DNA primase